VIVNLYATFRLHAGVKTLSLDLPAGATVFDAVNDIVTRLPALRGDWLDDEGRLHAHVHIFINGNDTAGLAEGLNTPLNPDDVLDFFPPVAGG